MMKFRNSDTLSMNMSRDSTFESHFLMSELKVIDDIWELESTGELESIGELEDTEELRDIEVLEDMRILLLWSSRISMYWCNIWIKSCISLFYM